MVTHLRSKIWKRHALFHIFATFMVLPFCSSLPENVLSLFSNTVKSFIFVGLKFRGLEFKNEFVDIKFRCFLICS